MNAGEISARLAERIEDLAETLLGCGPTHRTRTEIRFYPRGGLVITTAGSKRGLWCSHGDGGIGGDALDLIRHCRQCSTTDAIAWAEDWLGRSHTPPRPAPAYATPPKTNNVETAREIWREAVG